MAATYEGVKPFDSDAAYDALVAFDAAELYESALLYDAIIPYDDAGGTYLYDDPRLLYDGLTQDETTTPILGGIRPRRQRQRENDEAFFIACLM